MVSIPAIILLVYQKDLNPSIGFVMRLTEKCFCSTMLFRYLRYGTTVVRSKWARVLRLYRSVRWLANQLPTTLLISASLVQLAELENGGKQHRLCQSYINGCRLCGSSFIVGYHGLIERHALPASPVAAVGCEIIRSLLGSFFRFKDDKSANWLPYFFKNVRIAS